MIEVEKLVKKGEIDYILIESTGISEPIPVAQTFTYIDEEVGIDLTGICTLDTMVTVVDAYRFWVDYESGETLLDRKQTDALLDVRDISDLLMDQLEFVNIIVVNKMDLVTEEYKEEFVAFLRKVNPDAEIILTEFGRVEPSKLLNRQLFNFEKSSEGAGWIKELNEEHVPETDEYGITSFVYRRNRPFHPERWHEWLTAFPQEIVRAKGFFWLATRPEMAGLFSQAGSSLVFQGAGQWVAALPEIQQRAILDDDPVLLKRWDPVYGDRQTELVLIGLDMDREEVETSLDRCLLMDDEMLVDWSEFTDELPQFQG